MKHSLKIFEGIRVCFIGINDDEVMRMNDILVENGGIVTTVDDANCTHIVNFLIILQHFGHNI